jgi:hypothetical protein
MRALTALQQPDIRPDEREALLNGMYAYCNPEETLSNGYPKTLQTGSEAAICRRARKTMRRLRESIRYNFVPLQRTDKLTLQDGAMQIVLQQAEPLSAE